MATLTQPVDNNQVVFDNLLTNMMGMIEDLTDKYEIKDGEYKELAEGLMKIKNLQAHLKENKVYVTIQQRETRRRTGNARKYKIVSLEQKINNDDYINCEKCNRFILDYSGALKKHQTTSVCINTFQAKRTTHASKKLRSRRRAEIQQFLNIAMHKRINENVRYIDFGGEPADIGCFYRPFGGVVEGIDEDEYSIIPSIMRRKGLEYGDSFTLYDIMSA